MDDEIPLQGGSHACSSHETSLEPTTKSREGLGYNCERPVPNPSIWKESFTWIVPRIRSLRGGEFGRVTY